MVRWLGGWSVGWDGTCSSGGSGNNTTNVGTQVGTGLIDVVEDASDSQLTLNLSAFAESKSAIDMEVSATLKLTMIGSVFVPCSLPFGGGDGGNPNAACTAIVSHTPSCAPTPMVNRKSRFIPSHNLVQVRKRWGRLKRDLSNSARVPVGVGTHERGLAKRWVAVEVEVARLKRGALRRPGSHTPDTPRTRRGAWSGGHTPPLSNILLYVSPLPPLPPRLTPHLPNVPDNRVERRRVAPRGHPPLSRLLSRFV